LARDIYAIRGKDGVLTNPKRKERERERKKRKLIFLV